MSRRASPVMVGGFVLGALALLTLGVAIFGGGRFFSDSRTFILFFPESVRGLSEGAPVVLRGVRVGSVVSVNVQFDPEQLVFRIPVLIEVDPDHVQIAGTDNAEERSMDQLAEMLIDHGLRAQLQLESFVTGQLLIDLDLRPEDEARIAEVETPYMQIPTVPSGLEKLSKTLGEIPLEEVIHKTLSTLEGIERFVNAPELGASLKTLEKTLSRTHDLVDNLDRRIAGVGRNLNSALGEIRGLAGELDRQLDPLLTALQTTTETGRETLEGMQELIGSIEGMTGEDAEIRYRLGETLREISLAARSLRSLADYIEANPDALLRGRRGEGELR